MKYCTNCGTELKEGVKFCPGCGIKIISESLKKSSGKPDTEEPGKSSQVIEKINKKIELKNNQTPIVRRAWYAAGLFFMIIFLAFTEIIEIHPAIVMISIFFLLVSVIIAFMFRSREKKLQKLIDGKHVLAHWTLTPEQRKNYVQYLFKMEAGKNVIILLTISVIAFIVFGLFIIFIDEGKLFMLAALAGLIAFLALFAFGMPFYYRYKNSKGDGNILLGGKYAYINGYFHNWDFPLSGLSKIKIIRKPFYGIHLVYYYTDRTLTNSEELFIPANEELDLEPIVTLLKQRNAK